MGITYKNKFISSYNDNITAEEAKAIAKKKVGGEKPKKKKKKEERSDEITEDEAEVWATAACSAASCATPPWRCRARRSSRGTWSKSTRRRTGSTPSSARTTSWSAAVTPARYVRLM